jgi:RHS repeat-associated protein
LDKEPDNNVSLLNYKPLKRLIEHIRTIYRSNTSLETALPLYQLESLALPYENYQLAYIPGLLSDIFGSPNVFGSKINDTLLLDGKFTHSENDINWWIRSGTKQFTAGTETAIDARNRFYLPISFTDPYGSVTKVTYYPNYFLFVEKTEDVLGNKSSVDLFNFRTLSPQRMRDINDNLSEAISDELSLVKALAIMGKGAQADDLDLLTEETTEQNDIDDFFAIANADGICDSANLHVKAKDLLKHATARFVCDFNAYMGSGKPVVVSSIVRESHYKKADGSLSPDSKVQLSFEYSNGLGKVIMKKVQAEPGKAKQVSLDVNNNVTITDTNTSPLLRWIGNGRTILNNKGNAVKQYEQFFSVSPKFEDEKELVETGVTPIMYYDAAGRLIKTEMPNGTFSKVEFDSWQQTIFDANDTVIDSEWYLKRTDPSRTDYISDTNEQAAAVKAAAHYNTPSQLHFDTLGRAVLQIENNGKDSAGKDILYKTKLDLDIEGNLRKVTDAREIPENNYLGNVVMEYKYDMLGNNVYQKSMDAGQRWLFTNVLGNPLRTWDERNHEFQFEYDKMHRLTQSIVIGGDGPALLDNIFDRMIYGESLLTANRSNEATLQAINILGKPIQHYDTGGLTDTPEYDFKGLPVSTSRKVFINYKDVANWTDANLVIDLETDAYVFINEIDALGRITKQTAPDGSIITPVYNETGFLNAETVLRPSDPSASTYIKTISYNEKGQRSKIIYGNDVISKFEYDTETFRLISLNSVHSSSGVTDKTLQDLHYTYDPVGNITFIRDDAYDPEFFNNQIIEPISSYTYDALYRLTEAIGRENDAALNFGLSDNWDDAPFMQPSPITVKKYTQSYQYDGAGNLNEMKHVVLGNNWTRSYEYEKLNNRLNSTAVGDIANPQNYTKYTHHPLHGFLTELPHLDNISWNFKEEVVSTNQQRVGNGGIPEITYYQYDGQGQRIRKITENSAKPGENITPKEERIYIAGYEIYKKYSGSNAGLERISLSLMDKGQRFVMLETRNAIDDGTDESIVRYQLHNHLGSAALELDGTARVISYEEYHPYGTTAYQAKNKIIKAAAKRYRYTGMERDEETGLEYHSARYYMPWLGRWLSADPIGLIDGTNLFVFALNNPNINSDRTGLASIPEFPKERPEITTEIGRQAHKDILPRLVQRLSFVRLPSIPLLTPSKDEVLTQKGGSKPTPKSKGEKGSVDLIVFEPRYAVNIAGVKTSMLRAHFYELKSIFTGYTDSRLKSTNKKITWDRQLQNYLRHDAYNESPDEIYESNFGTILAKTQYRALVEAPMPVNKGQFTRWYFLRLPPGQDNKPIPGLIEYTFVDVKNKSDIPISVPKNDDKPNSADKDGTNSGSGEKFEGKLRGKAANDDEEVEPDKEIKPAAKADEAAKAIVFGYICYRFIRMVPSVVVPPLWPTMIPNAVVP